MKYKLFRSPGDLDKAVRKHELVAVETGKGICRYHFNSITHRWMVPMQVGFLRIYKMKLSSYDNNFQFSEQEMMIA